MYEVLHQYLKYLQHERKLSENSFQSYERDLMKFAAYVEGDGVTAWSRVHKHHILKYMNILKERKLKPATIARHIVSIRAMFHYFMLNDLISYDPTIYFETPKQQRKSPHVISQEIMKSLLQAPNCNSAAGLRDKAMLELLYATGIRVSELMNLDIEHVHVSLGFIQCMSPSKKERFVPFGHYAKEAIQAYLQQGRAELVNEKHDEQALFLSHLGKRMTRQGFWKMLKKYAVEAGIEEEVTPHTLRHSVASHLLENGADIRAVQELMGHSDIASTLKYTAGPKQKIKDVYTTAHPRA